MNTGRFFCIEIYKRPKYIGIKKKTETQVPIFDSNTVKRLHLKKGQIIQSTGDLNSKVFRVESGLLRSYTIDDKGKEYIYMFAPEN